MLTAPCSAGMQRASAAGDALLQLCSLVRFRALATSATATHGHPAPQPPRPQQQPAEAADQKPALSQKVRFVDKLRIEARGGKGGNGSVAYCPAGRGRHLKADGGHGGRGGDVLLVATKRILSLAGIQQVSIAADGDSGHSQRRNGANGQARLVQVPVGTIVKKFLNPHPESLGDLREPDVGEELDSSGMPMWMTQPHKPTYGLLDSDDEEEAEDGSSSSGSGSGSSSSSSGSSSSGGGGGGGSSSSGHRLRGAAGHSPAASVGSSAATERAAKLRRRAREEVNAVELGTLLHEGEQLLVATGGAGGLGNVAFRNKPYGPPSDQCEEGREGERVRLLLEARLIADVGLVGLPNAGKSTLLRALTGARAQVGQYEFTTLRPQLGALMFEGGARLTVADIPGLLAGAASGAGRGNEFLRHIERTRCLLYVVDLGGGSGGLVRLPAAQQLRVLQRELRMYRPSLLQAPAVVVANKVDSVADPQAALQQLQAATSLPVVPVSAEQSVGLELLKAAVQQLAPPQLPD